MDGEAHLAPRLDLHILPPAQRAASPALVRGRRDHPDVLAALPGGAFQYRQSGGVYPVIVDDDNAAITQAHGAGRVSVQSRERTLHTKSVRISRRDHHPEHKRE